MTPGLTSFITATFIVTADTALVSNNLALRDDREVGRDEVHYRARAFGADAQASNLLVVNMSPHGLMARCDRDHAEGDRIRIVLPVAGSVAAEVRWSLGGRIGTRFDTAFDLASYYEMLATMLKG